MRIEYDLLGEVLIDDHAEHGAQTQRALDLYPLQGSKALGDYPYLLRALLQVKKACATTNANIGELPKKLADAITASANSLLEPLSSSSFPVHALHGGGGISTNMNLNEVIANRANHQFFQQHFGSYQPIHPNDHVNLNHATSDLLNTASRLALIERWDRFCHTLEALEQQFTCFIGLWGDTPKIARTCLQDAVEIRFADLFGGYLHSVRRHRRALSQSIDTLHQVNLGGNIIGRQGDCSSTFYQKIIAQLAKTTGQSRLSRMENLFDASQNHDDFVSLSHHLEQLAMSLLRISKDIRLMASGPQTGLGEIRLPAVQQGSSAMPGKINPTIPEFLIQACMQVSGLCHAVAFTQSHGELDYSPWQSIVICNLLDAFDILENAMDVFSRHAMQNMHPVPEKNQENLQTLIPVMVKLMQQKGYAEASALFKQHQGDLVRLRAELVENEQPNPANFSARQPI